MSSNDELYGKWLESANVWLDQFGTAAELYDRRKAFVGLRAALHALRDRLPPEEIAHLGAQLPMLLKGVYFDGWAPSRQPLKIRQRSEFVERVRHYIGDDPGIDPELCTDALFELLSEHVSRGEIADIVQTWPHELRQLWPDAQRL
jgi:uncharacterized protein (DUF2267 family)